MESLNYMLTMKQLSPFLKTCLAGTIEDKLRLFLIHYLLSPDLSEVCVCARACGLVRMWHNSPSARGGATRRSAAESRCRSGTNRVYQEMEVSDYTSTSLKNECPLLCSLSLYTGHSWKWLLTLDLSNSHGQGPLQHQWGMVPSPITITYSANTSFCFSGIFEHISSKMLAGVRNFVIRTKVVPAHAGCKNRRGLYSVNFSFIGSPSDKTRWPVNGNEGV